MTPSRIVVTLLKARDEGKSPSMGQTPARWTQAGQLGGVPRVGGEGTLGLEGLPVFPGATEVHLNPCGTFWAPCTCLSPDWEGVLARQVAGKQRVVGEARPSPAPGSRPRSVKQSDGGWDAEQKTYIYKSNIC